MWNLRDKPKTTFNYREQMDGYQKGGRSGAGGGEWNSDGNSEYTYHEHQVMYRIGESLYCTHIILIMLCVNYTGINFFKSVFWNINVKIFW